MQGIRWRVLDLSYCPDRMSSWKELAQVSAWVNFDRFLVFFRCVRVSDGDECGAGSGEVGVRNGAPDAGICCACVAF